MRILYLHQYFCPPDGWGNDRSLAFAGHWVAAGHEVTVLTSPAYFPPAATVPPQQTIDGIDVHVLQVPYSHAMGYLQRSWAFLRFFTQLLAYARRLPRPDVIYASSTPLSVGEAGRRLAKHFRVPFVLETVDVWPDVPQGMGILRNRLLLRLLHRAAQRMYHEAAAVVVLSEGMRAQVCRHGVPVGKILVSHNGTNPSAFTPAAAAPPDPPVRLLYAGTLGPANGVDGLLYALQRLPSDLPHWQCDILGWGKTLPQLKALATSLELADRVFFHEPVPKRHLLPWMQQAHIGIVTFAPFPVLEANSANKFFDYLAAGLPVVLNYQGWQAEYLREWDCGLAAPMGDTSAFAANLAALIQDAAVRARMGGNARALAVQQFDRRVLAATVLARLQQAVTQP